MVTTVQQVIIVLEYEVPTFYSLETYVTFMSPG